MSIQLLKKSLHELIDSIQDAELLAAYYKILTSREKPDWWNEISFTEKKSIEAGLADIKNGDIISHEQIMKEVDLLLKRSK